MNGEKANPSAETNDRNHDERPSKNSQSTTPESAAPAEAFESKDRFDALVRDRDSLRAEVVDMRRSLEEIQSKHGAETESLQGKVSEAESKKEHAEVQFQKLLERVNTIKAQLGERLKEDAVRWTLPIPPVPRENQKSTPRLMPTEGRARSNEI